MRRSQRRLAAIGTGILLAAGLAVAVPGTAGAHPRHHHGNKVRITEVIGGLNSPRGITFDGKGNMYVAEAGAVGNTKPPGLTMTGAVSKYRFGSSHPRWTTSFESFFEQQDPKSPPDVLGPAGLSILDRSCWHHGRGCSLSMIMSESHDGLLKTTGIQTTQMGHLFHLNRHNGSARSVSDVGDQSYAFTTVHKDLFPPDFPDANPYGVLVTKRSPHHDEGRWHGDSHRVRTFVADAGANTINEVMRNGRIRVIAYIPNETSPPNRDATPTCIAQGRDGYLYVGTLHLVAGEGRADVWRVNPNANFPTPPTLWASGLTTITSCTFDRWGNFWATEMFKDAGPKKLPGDVVRINGHNPNDQDHFGLGRLPLGGGIAQGPDGAMYITINSANPAPGTGEVVRLSLRHHHH